MRCRQGRGPLVKSRPAGKSPKEGARRLSFLRKAGIIISYGNMFDMFELEELHMPENGRKKQILRSDLHRPGLALAGFTDFFDNKRLLLMSRSETAYLRQLEPELRKSRIDEMLSRRSPALILARGVIPLPELREACQSFGVPLLRSGESSTILTSKLFEYLRSTAGAC